MFHNIKLHNVKDIHANKTSIIICVKTFENAKSLSLFLSVFVK